MTRIILKTLNPVFFVLLALAATGVQTSLFAAWPLNYLQPDLLLLGVVWFALRRDFLEGGILTLIFAEIAEVHSAVPQGAFLIAYMSTYLVVRAAALYFVIPDLYSLVTVALLCSIFSKLATTTVVALLLGNTAPWRNMIFLLFPGAAIVGVFGIFVFRWLEPLDFYTFKNRRAEHSIDEELKADHPDF